MALFGSQAGRTIVRCVAIVGILFVYNYLIFVKIIIAVLVISEVAAWIIPLFTPTKRGGSSTFVPPDHIVDNDQTHSGPCGPYGAPSSGVAEKQEEDIYGHLKHLDMQPERDPIIFPPAANTSNYGNRTGPSGSNRRQQEEIGRHLQRLMAAAKAEADAAANVVSPHYFSENYGERGIGGSYPDRMGGTLGAASYTSSNPSAPQADDNHRQHFDFRSRNKFPGCTGPTVDPQATSHQLRYGSPSLGHSKSLPESTTVSSHQDFYRSWQT